MLAQAITGHWQKKISVIRILTRCYCGSGCPSGVPVNMSPALWMSSCILTLCSGSDWLMRSTHGWRSRRTPPSRRVSKGDRGSEEQKTDESRAGFVNGHLRKTNSLFWSTEESFLKDKIDTCEHFGLSILPSFHLKCCHCFLFLSLCVLWPDWL